MGLNKFRDGGGCTGIIVAVVLGVISFFGLPLVSNNPTPEKLIAYGIFAVPFVFIVISLLQDLFSEDERK